MRSSRVLVLLGGIAFSVACAGPTSSGQGATANMSRTDQTIPWFSNVGEGVPPFWVRPGFKVTLVASNLQNARFMEFDDKGTLYLSRPDRGDILTMRRDGDNYKIVNTFAKPGRSVHGMYFKNGWLWFTKSGSVHRGRDKDGDGKADEIVDVLTGLPSGGHWWRAILVVDDGFFTSIGSTGNITEEEETDRQKIWKYSLDGKTRKLWSGGLRNTEKLLYRPGTTELYGADQGSDWYGAPLGDKQGNQPITDWIPPCEFNLYVEGGFYGHPYMLGDRIPRLEYQNKKDIVEIAAKTIPPMWNFGAHWAPDGWCWVTKPALGPDFVGDALVGMHGSWNSSKPVGYRVERVNFDKSTGVPFGSQMLVGTVGKDGRVIGRPVDVTQEPDGNILFSDDMNNAIYRISPAKG